MGIGAATDVGLSAWWSSEPSIVTPSTDDMSTRSWPERRSSLSVSLKKSPNCPPRANEVVGTVLPIKDQTFHGDVKKQDEHVKDARPALVTEH